MSSGGETAAINNLRHMIAARGGPCCDSHGRLIFNQVLGMMGNERIAPQQEGVSQAGVGSGGLVTHLWLAGTRGGVPPNPHMLLRFMCSQLTSSVLTRY